MKSIASCAVVAIICFTFSLKVYALPTGRDVYFGSHAEGTERTFYRDGVTVMPNANRLQPVLAIDEVNDGVSTNAANNYLSGNDILYTQTLAATTLGSDPLLGGYADGSGEWNTRIEGGDTDLGGNMYYVRLFSAPSVTGAAYYADTTNIYGTFPTTEYYTFTDMLVNVVNPAYAIPGFGVVFVTNWHLELDAAVMSFGDVGTTTAGGNNQLADSMVSVRWENVTLGTSGYVSVNSGTWSANEIPLLTGSPEPETNVLRFIAVGISPRPGLPVSQVEERYVLAVPEPCGVLALLAFAWVWRRR